MATFSPHVALDVPDRQEAVAFYERVLDMTAVEDGPDETILECGDARFYVQEADESRVYLEFAVEDIDRTVETLEGTDSERSTVTTPEGGRSYIVTDPFGISYHLFERTE